MVVALLHQVGDFERHQHARKEKELVEAEVGRVYRRVAIGLEVLLQRPWVVHSRAHSELAYAKHHDPQEDKHSQAVHHLQVVVFGGGCPGLTQLSHRILDRHNA